MAIFHPIEYFGIAFDRDITIQHETEDRRSGSISSPTLSVISLSISKRHQDLITRQPWFLAGCPRPSVHSDASPSQSFANLVPEDLFVSSDHGPGHIALVPDDKPNLFGSIEWVPDELTPINQYIRSPERHEKIAASLALNTKCQQPYLDYLPCPGSGPVSAAASVETNYETQPAEVAVQPRAPAPAPNPVLAPTPTAAPPWTQIVAEPVRMSTPTEDAPIMMRRYLADFQEPDWLSIVLENPPQYHDQEQDTQIHDHPDQEMHREAHRSISERMDSEPAPSLGFSLGKRALPDWETDMEPAQSSDIIVPDDPDQETRMLSEVVKDRMNALAANRPRLYKTQRVHLHKKRRTNPFKDDGSSSPVSTSRSY